MHPQPDVTDQFRFGVSEPDEAGFYIRSVASKGCDPGACERSMQLHFATVRSEANRGVGKRFSQPLSFWKVGLVVQNRDESHVTVFGGFDPLSGGILRYCDGTDASGRNFVPFESCHAKRYVGFTLRQAERSRIRDQFYHDARVLLLQGSKCRSDNPRGQRVNCRQPYNPFESDVPSGDRALRSQNFSLGAFGIAKNRLSSRRKRISAWGAL